MLNIQALADIGNAITLQEVKDELYVIAELLDYLRWLAEQDTSTSLSAGDVWELYHEGVRMGRAWSEVCEDLGLPVRTVW